MGCDIHLYIEYKKNDGQDTWKSFSGRMDPGRNYALFSLLANVRNYNESPVSFEPRGMPTDAGFYADHDNSLYISDDASEDSVHPDIAKKWVECGSAKYINDAYGKPVFVTHPDWHSHSWLTTAEYEKVLNEYLGSKSEYGYEPEYQVVLASMKRFEELGYISRIVFWFDN